ncbi:MAG: glycine zipper domain-containing protein [Planctomycetota bacterium]|nr:glycine zipper domain-containing protein [Planctomycetota bacterium]
MTPRSINGTKGRLGLAGICVLGLSILTGCETDAQFGSLFGAGLGALAGQAIGGDTEGTLIGTAIGAGVGYVIGNESDKQHHAQADGYYDQGESYYEGGGYERLRYEEYPSSRGRCRHHHRRYGCHYR